MQSVSQEWKDNQNARLVSESFIELSIDLTDPSAMADATVYSTNVMTVSSLQTIIDDNDIDRTPYATLEQNLWVLDGSREILPTSSYGNTGYISSSMSDENGSFSSRPMIIVSFPEVHTSLIQGLYINWGARYNEYATSFTVDVFNGNTLIATKEVTDNKDVKTTVFMDLSGFDAIRIAVNKWCVPNHRARMTTFMSGTKFIFDKNDLISFTHTQEADPIASSLVSTSISFSLDNTKDTYNPFNDKGKTKYFSANQEIKVKYGYDIDGTVEWIQGGTFYLSEWGAKQNGNSAEFSAATLLDLMTNQFEHEGYNTSEISLYDLAEKVLTCHTIPQWIKDKLSWRIDETLRDITTKGSPHGHTCAEALQYIANAACCKLYVDRDGAICIEPMILDNIADDYSVTPDNSYSKPETTPDKTIKQITIIEHDFHLEDNDTERIDPSTIPTSGSANTTLMYSCGYARTKIGDDIWRADFTEDRWWYPVIPHGTDWTVEHIGERYPTYCTAIGYAIINGYRRPTSIRGYEIVTDKATHVISVNPLGEELTIENPLVTSEERVIAVGNWIVSYLTRQNVRSLKWRADPRLDVLDIIRSKDEFTDNNLILTKVEYAYNGAFKGAAEGRVI